MPGPTEKLDSLVLNIELTLISIIQGVALYFLVENSRSVVVNGEFIYWPYVFTGLLVIFLFWSRVIIHMLTVIRWPLEFGHNFLYIAATLFESMAFTQVKNPAGWFALNSGFALMIWLLFFLDLKMIRRAGRYFNNPADGELYSEVVSEQLKGMRYWMPATLFFNLIFAIGFQQNWPQLATAPGIATVGCLQGLAAAFYLRSSIVFFRKLSPLIQRARA